MKTYIFFFILPDNTKIYCTGNKNGVSIDRFLARGYQTTDPDDLKDHIQDGFNECWEENPGYSDGDIWRGFPLEKITLDYEEISDQEAFSGGGTSDSGGLTQVEVE